MFSLRAKLIIVLTSFVIILLGISAILFVREKQSDIRKSAEQQTEFFAEATSEKLVENFESYFLQENRIFFETFIQEVFSRNSALQSLQIVTYDGEVVYDSISRNLENDDAGETVDQRSFIQDEALLNQIQSRSASLQTEEGEIRSFVVPVSERYSIIYHFSYDFLDEEITRIRNRILTLILFGILFGIGFAFFFAYRLNRPVEQLIQSANIIAKGDLKHRVDIRSGDEFELLGKSFNSMIESVNQYLSNTLYRERVSKELELAAKIQKDLLPKENPRMNDFDFAFGLLPALEIGGDIYDFLNLSENRFVTYVADVMGHGIPAVFGNAVAGAIFASYAEKFDPLQSLILTNKVLKSRIPENTFVTFGLLFWDGQKMFHLNAGHESVLHFHAKEKKITASTLSGVGLGMVPDISSQLRYEEIDFQSGDVLLLYSDGVSSAWKNEKENYGIARLKRAFTEYATLPTALAVRNALLADVKEFMGSYRQTDDMTVVVIRKI